MKVNKSVALQVFNLNPYVNRHVRNDYPEASPERYTLRLQLHQLGNILNVT